jgi:hypothetical protein
VNRARPQSAKLIPVFTALALGACSPSLPEGVDERRLAREISGAIGDPNTCVLIAPSGSDKVAYRYNTYMTCARSLPACEAPDKRTVNDLLAQVARDGAPRAMSCPSNDDGSRGVAWAAGAIEGRGLVYAAVMEGERAFPGRMMAERLARAFKDAGL